MLVAVLVDVVVDDHPDEETHERLPLLVGEPSLHPSAQLCQEVEVRRWSLRAVLGVHGGQATFEVGALGSDALKLRLELGIGEVAPDGQRDRPLALGCEPLDEPPEETGVGLLARTLSSASAGRIDLGQDVIGVAQPALDLG